MKKPIAVYVVTTNNIGVIIEEGKDEMGEWYRTDCDGVRDPHELLFLYNKKEIKKCKRQLKANIAPSTKELLGL